MTDADVRINISELVQLLAEPIARAAADRIIEAHEGSCPWRQLPFWKIILIAGFIAGSTGAGVAALL